MDINELQQCIYERVVANIQWCIIKRSRYFYFETPKQDNKRLLLEAMNELQWCIYECVNVNIQWCIIKGLNIFISRPQNRTIKAYYLWPGKGDQGCVPPRFAQRVAPQAPELRSSEHTQTLHYTPYHIWSQYIYIISCYF